LIENRSSVRRLLVFAAALFAAAVPVACSATVERECIDVPVNGQSCSMSLDCPGTSPCVRATCDKQICVYHPNPECPDVCEAL